jgi:uncharacterized membrane protein
VHEWTPSNKLIRLAIALVWLYQGFWCKVLGGIPRHEAVIASVPFIGSAAGRSALIALGLLECALAYGFCQAAGCARPRSFKPRCWLG